MCGITGQWNFDGSAIDAGTFGNFLRTLSHRGPNASDVFIDSRRAVALGNCRLAITDASYRAGQPMSSADGRFTISFNGAIYNFVELRRQLQKLGHSFVSDSDTEVVLAAYREWGTSCQLRFNGMWAFAIWDSQTRELFLSRDRFGVKPLYFMSDKHRFTFASELKAFRALPGYNRDLNWKFIAASLSSQRFQSADTETFLADVVQLQAGHCVTVTQDGRQVIARWWRTVDHIAPVPESFSDQAELLKELLTDACAIRSVVDQPHALSLSGGVDSSSILAVLCAQGAPPTSTYTAAFSDRLRDESSDTTWLTSQLGVEANLERTSRPTSLDDLDRIILHAEDTRTLHLGNWAVFQAMARDGVPIALSGDGSDELFAAYPWHMDAACLERSGLDFEQRKARQRLRREMDTSAVGAGPGEASRWRQDLTTRWLDLTQSRGTQFHPGQAFDTPLAGGEYLNIESAEAEQSCFVADLMNLPDDALLSKQLYFDFHSGILPWILHLKDAISMAHGVELRSPFMDWRIVTFAFGLQSTSLIDERWTKRVVREAVRGVLPDRLRTQPTKTSFVNSERSAFWQLKPLILDAVNDPAFLESPLWHGKHLRVLAEKSYREGIDVHAEFLCKCVKTSRLALHLTAG